MAPTFAFIDPFGFKGVPIQLVGRLLAFDRCEVFFYFMYNRVNQFLAAERITSHLNGLFGTRDYIQACDLDPGARVSGSSTTCTSGSYVGPASCNTAKKHK